jgi:hypothetical protein
VAILRQERGNFDDAYPPREPDKYGLGPRVPQETEAAPNSDFVLDPPG